MKAEIKEKTVLVDGLLCTRDIVAFAGRRKNGKTTLLSNLGMYLASGQPDFLGYTIPQATKVLGIFLEDDIANIREKLGTLYQSLPTQERLGIITSEELMDRGFLPDVSPNSQFVHHLRREVKEFAPSLILMDNMSALVKGHYNDADIVDQAFIFCRELGRENDSAVVIAAHPRKRGHDEQQFLLRNDPETFYENIMGSSHFINSADSIWGVEKIEEGRSYFRGGELRRTGHDQVSVILLDDEGRLHLEKDDRRGNEKFALNTLSRTKAWGLLGLTPFSRREGAERVGSVMSQASFYRMIADCQRLGLVEEIERGVFIKHG